MAGREAKLNAVRGALVAFALCLALAACSGTKLYAPEGSIQERLHDLSYMCRAYLFEEGGSYISFEYLEYAPQIDSFLQSEIRRLEAICRNPGGEFTTSDIEQLQEGVKFMRELSDSINEGLRRFDPDDPSGNIFASPWDAWAHFDRFTKYIDERHRKASGSDALYK
jgi:hypothetical protein